MSCKGGNCNCGKGNSGHQPGHSSLVFRPGDLSRPGFMRAADRLKIEEQFIQVRFRGNRKAFYRASAGWLPDPGDLVIVEAEGGYDLGCVTLTGERALELYRSEMAIADPGPGRILRKAEEPDTRLWLNLRRKERELLALTRRLARMIDPGMEIRDAEIRGDGGKIRIWQQYGNPGGATRLEKEIGSVYGIPAVMERYLSYHSGRVRHSHDVRHGRKNGRADGSPQMRSPSSTLPS